MKRGKKKSVQSHFGGVRSRCFFPPFFLLVTLSVCCVYYLPMVASKAYAQGASLPLEIRELLGTLRKSTPGNLNRFPESEESTRLPQFFVGPDGYLRNLSAPRSAYFPVSGIIQGNTTETARNFLRQHKHVLGAGGTILDFRNIRSRMKDGRNYERFEQIYDGIPVFGGQVIVQLNELSGVEYLLSDISRDARLNNGILSTSPSIQDDEALKRALDLFLPRRDDLKINNTEPRLMIFDPAVLDATGDVRLVWEVKVTCEEAIYINEQILLDAQTGEIVRRYPLYKAINQRIILDANNTDSGTVIREEGDGPTGIPHIDNAYDFIGHARDFYLVQHGRFSIWFDDIWPIPLKCYSFSPFCNFWVVTRYCNPAQVACPGVWDNAMWSDDRLYFADGLVADDFVGHEYTHGVTENESDLIYENHPGAINESFSDIWGEFIDMSNGAGTDTDPVRWLIGEDTVGGAIRSMKDPPLFGQPDRMSDPRFVQPVSNPDDTNDWGGVHRNSGVGNKLAYLLTDGGYFNGQPVWGLGMANVANLFYEVQIHLLSSAASYYDLYYALRQAAFNLSWPVSWENNLLRATRAVEIAGSGIDIYVSKDGDDDGPGGGVYCGMQIDSPCETVGKGYWVARPGDRLVIEAGSYNESLVIDKILTIFAVGGSAVIGR